MYYMFNMKKENRLSISTTFSKFKFDTFKSNHTHCSSDSPEK